MSLAKTFLMKSFAISFLLLVSLFAHAGEKVLYSFQGGADGQLPLAGVVSDSAGNLYGTTKYGGSGPCTSADGNGCGVIFKVSPSGQGWTETVLYSFQGKGDGQYPIAGLAIDSSGNLYGTTPGVVGVGSCPPACGNIFEFSSVGAFTILHKFTGGVDGTLPTTGLTIDPSGGIYGTTDGSDHGTVFQISNSSGKWKLTTLYAFTGGNDGGDPTGPPLFGPDGSLYGGAAGIIYRLHFSTKWHEQVIYSFGKAGNPRDSLAFDAKGNVYTVTVNGYLCQLTPTGHVKWTEKVVHHFHGIYQHHADGTRPAGGVAIDGTGNLYGVTIGGGNGEGTVYKVSWDGTKWNETILHNFNNESDGLAPIGLLIWGLDGNLYGVTQVGGNGCGAGGCGTVFEITP
jgi:uncharacterized repeat protein (TIGR03803 family)